MGFILHTMGVKGISNTFLSVGLSAFALSVVPSIHSKCGLIHFKDEDKEIVKTMDSSEIKDYLLNTLCRICAEKSAKLIPIFEIKFLPLKINKCLPIKVSAGDDLPTKVCEMCLIKIDESYTHYETCFYADQRLKKLWKTLTKQPSESELYTSDNLKICMSQNNGECYEDQICDKAVSEALPSSSKKIPVSVILVNDAVASFECLDFQQRNKLNEELSPSDILINMTDDVGCGTLDILDSGKDQAVEFIVDNEMNDLSVVEPHKSTDCNVKLEVKHVEDDNVKIKKTVEQDEKQTQTRVYQCKFCPQQLSSASSLNIHESTHSQVKSFLCDTCGKAFKHANNLKSHSKIHSTHRKKYTCKICNKSFFTNFFLREHMNSHTGETPYKCTVCGKDFREKVHLRQHKWTHSSQKFLCPVCGSHFNRKGNMTEHMKKYHPSNENEKRPVKKETRKQTDLNFSCPVCSKSFSTQVLMKNHHRHHANKEVHFCSLCGKQFRHSGSLTYHRRTAHTGEKPFQCGYCDERFTLRSVQRIHERKTHTFEYPYRCQFCPRMFNNSSSLKNHSYVHMKEKMFECDICGKKFTRNSNLFVHKKIHSDDRQFSCEQCGKSYIQKHDLIKHRKVHDPKSKPFFCKYCGNNFAHKRDFARHAICHFDYIRKSNSEKCSAERILDTVTGDVHKTSKTLIEAERLILESPEDFLEEKLDKIGDT